MAVTRAQRVRLGIFVGVGLALTIGGLAILAGMQLSEERDLYQIRYSDGAISLSGLEVGSPVKYSGIRVGRVEKVAVDTQDVSVIVVSVSLQGGTPVAEDTKASLGSQGITGLKYVELTRGSRDARIRTPGEDIPPGTSSLDALTDQAGEIAAKVSIALDNVNAMTGPDMRQRVAKVLDRADAVLSEAEKMVHDNQETVKNLAVVMGKTGENVARLSDEFSGSAKRLNALFDDVRPRTRRLLDEAAGVLKDGRTALASLDGALVEGKRVLGPKGTQKLLISLQTALERVNLLMLQSREDVSEAMTYFRETTENMSEFSEKIRDDPSLLLLSSDEEGIE